MGSRITGVGHGGRGGRCDSRYLSGRIQELGMGRMWRCWGQVGSYRILHVGGSGGESTMSMAGCEEERDVMGCLAWGWQQGAPGAPQSRMGLACALQ